MPSPSQTIPSQDLFVNSDVGPSGTDQKAPSTFLAKKRSGARDDGVKDVDGWHVWSSDEWSTLLDMELSEVVPAPKTRNNPALSNLAILSGNAEEPAGNHGIGGGRATPSYFGVGTRRWMNSDEVFIILIGVLTHILTRFGFGWDWLLILLAFCATYYMTTTKRIRARTRDDIARKLARTRLTHTPEQAEWINHLIERVWPIYEPLFAHELTTRVNQILDANHPTFLDSLHLNEFTMGTKAIEVLQIRTHPGTTSDVVEMDWHLRFTPNQALRHPREGHFNGVSSRIVLSASIAGADVPVLVENISLTGWLKVRIKLREGFPHVKTVDLFFMEQPVVDHALEPLGEDTFSFDIAELHIPGLSAFIRDTIHSTLHPMYYPNRLTLDVCQLLPEEPLNALFGAFLSTFFPQLNSPFGSRRRSE